MEFTALFFGEYINTTWLAEVHLEIPHPQKHHHLCQNVPPSTHQK